ncbi:polysaccharide deacetylase family protein [Xanthobacter sp. KR7-225]|uniref:polysaccharide deacetylase family protein n=1 Tax=Xanthobacter sp. KR7-225 TaxID=3156613 RepID=UPI0032B5000C
MKTFIRLFAVLATGVLGLSCASAQMMGPPPATGAGAPTAGASTASAPSGAPARPAKITSYSSMHVDGPYIAITFDDGPNPETTLKLLKMLEQRGIKATFFVLGSRAVQSPEILKQMVAQGHEIGNHSWNHPILPKVGVAETDRQLTQTNDVIEKITGKKPIYLRPPYGAMSAPLRKHIEDKYDLTFIYWSVDTLDWKNKNPEKIYELTMKQIGPGGIILAHDIHPTTVQAMPKVLDALLARGYKFVTVSQLVAMNKPEPPKVAALSPAPPKKPKPKPAGATASAGTGATPAPKPKPKPVAATGSTQRPPATPVRSTGTGLY